MRFFKGLLIAVVSVFLVCYAEVMVFADTKSKTVHSYASAVKLATPSVVNVYTARRSTQFHNPRTYPSSNKRILSLGSGVVIDTDGYILTNYHVVRNADQILVALDDGRHAKAKVVGVDQDTDLAVLKITLNALHPAVIANSDHVHVGDVVLAIGNPFGLGQTVTQGIVSAIGRSTIGINQLENYIQTDAAINPGNSGGALINTEGKVIGINTAIYSRSGGYQGVGFAIPITVALNVMHQIIKTGSVKRGWLGLRIRTLVPSLAKAMKLSRDSGVVVVELLKKSPASKAGLKVGDVITFLNNQRVRTAQGFLSYIAQREPGSKVVVVFTRDNQTYRIEIPVGIRPPPPVIDDRAHGYGNF